ncbi:MAG: SAM-dependent methyltransferase [Parachlamydia sp.]|nr:SAM-dependent methyltransferase [Parachlamydia sp.]
MSDLPAKPTLLLLPNLLGEQPHHDLFLPASVDRAVASIDDLISESPTAGRRYLGRFQTKKPAHEIPIALYNEHNSDQDLDFLLEPIRKGERWGLVSDGGLPCIADPGSKLVARARQTGINVQAFVGPSAILLSLMLSGLPGQRFAFHGYLDKDPATRKKQISNLAKRSRQEDSTQIFIEAPYRNKHVLEMLVETLDDQTQLCVAWELTLPSQGTVSQPISLWKKSPLPNLEKRNAIFLIY